MKHIVQVTDAATTGGMSNMGSIDECGDGGFPVRPPPPAPPPAAACSGVDLQATQSANRSVGIHNILSEISCLVCLQVYFTRQGQEEMQVGLFLALEEAAMVCDALTSE